MPTGPSHGIVRLLKRLKGVVSLGFPALIRATLRWLPDCRHTELGPKRKSTYSCMAEQGPLASSLYGASSVRGAHVPVVDCAYGC